MDQTMAERPMTREETLVLARAARTRARLDRHADELRGHGFIVIEPEAAAVAKRLLLGRPGRTQ